MTKGHKRYICENCYAKDHQVHEDYINNCFEREWTTRESELLEEIKRLKVHAENAKEETRITKEELLDSKKAQGDLISRIKSLEGENERSENRLRAQGKTITSLRKELSVKSKEPNDTEKETLVAQVAEMEEELAAFKQSVQDYETNEAALKSKVLVSEENLKK